MQRRWGNTETAGLCRDGGAMHRMWGYAEKIGLCRDRGAIQRRRHNTVGKVR